MSTYWGLYWLTRLENIIVLLGTLSGVGTFICGLMFLLWLISENYETCNSYSEVKFLTATRKIMKRIWISLIPILIVLWSIFALIPTQKEAIFIVAGGKTLNWAISDSSLSKIPSQSTQLMSDFLEQQISELTKDVSGDVKSAKDSLSKEIKNSVTKNLLK